MSVGFHVRIGSYIRDPAMAEKELSAINRILLRADLPPYQEPTSDPTPTIYARTLGGLVRLGRAALEHTFEAASQSVARAYSCVKSARHFDRPVTR